MPWHGASGDVKRYNNSLPNRGDECDEESVGLGYAPHNILGGHSLAVAVQA